MSEQNQAIPNPMLDAAKRQAEELLDMVAAEQRTHEATRAERDRLRAELAAERERAADINAAWNGEHAKVERLEAKLWTVGIETEQRVDKQYRRADAAEQRAAQAEAEAARQRAALDEIANSMCNDIAHPHCILAERALTESAGRELLEAGDEVTQRSGQLEELLKHGLVGMHKSVGLETGVMTVSLNDWQEWDRKSIVALDAYAAALARYQAVRGKE